MRRSDREVTDINKIIEILNSCKTCHIAMQDKEYPYVVPLSYGYDMNNDVLTLYFHCAYEGRKINLLKTNGKVGFEICNEGEPIYAKDTPCNSGYYYSSIIGTGEVEFVEDISQKCDILKSIMKRQADFEYNFNAQQAKAVETFKINVNYYTAKQKMKVIRDEK